jgi:hypothetical protein
VLTVVDYEDADYNLRRGSFAHAATVYRAKGVVTYDAWAAIDRVDGQQLQITLGNGRRLFFAAHFNMGRLYILEVDNGPRAAAPIQFLQGMIFLDENGARVRYSETGARMERTDDLPEALGGPDLDGPILEGGSDEYIP